MNRLTANPYRLKAGQSVRTGAGGFGGTHHYMGKHYIPLGNIGAGPGGENLMGADGTRGGGSPGQPVYHDKAAAMDRATANTQQHVDAAAANAKARAAEMGLDYTPGQEQIIAQAGALAGASNTAGWGVDRENVGTANQFALADKQNEHALKMQTNSISASQSAQRADDALRWANFNEHRRQRRYAQLEAEGELKGMLAGSSSAQTPKSTLRTAWNRQNRFTTAPSTTRRQDLDAYARRDAAVKSAAARRAAVQRNSDSGYYTINGVTYSRENPYA